MLFLNRELNTCVISAGGRGTRLKEITNDFPKPLFPINNLSCLERTLNLLIEQKIFNIFILTCYKKQLFESIVNKYNKNINITLIEEDKPLGECGGLWLINDRLNGEVLFINADLIWEIDLRRFFEFHSEHKSDVTLLTHTCTHIYDSDLIEESANKQINKFSLKPHCSSSKTNMFLGNAGIGIFNSNILKVLNPPLNKSPSFCNYILNNMKKYNLKVYSYNSTEFVKDIGTSKRFKEVESLIKANAIRKKSYRNKQKCLFLDRDNTLIKCHKNEYIISINQVEFITNNIYKISKIREQYDLAIIVTNQPQIAMGLVDWPTVISINSFVIEKCLNLGLKIDSFNLCPHHYDSGFKKEVSQLKQDCFCRKPKPGLILQEALSRNIDLKNSLMIGDHVNDEIAALRAGCKFKYIDNLTT